MLLVYMSLTGQTRKFVKKSGFESIELEPTNPFITVEEPYILVVPTYEVDVTEIINDFLETGDNVSLCKGIFGGGNRNFAELFCFTADDLSKEYGIPVLHRFEFQGSKNDIEKLRKEVDKFAN